MEVFIFDSIDGDEDSLYDLVLECKSFNIFDLNYLKNQLKLIDLIYRRQSNYIWEILKNYSPNEVKIPYSICALENEIVVYPGLDRRSLYILLEIRVEGLKEMELKINISEYQSVNLEKIGKHLYEERIFIMESIFSIPSIAVFEIFIL